MKQSSCCLILKGINHRTSFNALNSKALGFSYLFSSASILSIIVNSTSLLAKPTFLRVEGCSKSLYLDTIRPAPAHFSDSFFSSKLLRSIRLLSFILYLSLVRHKKSITILYDDYQYNLVLIWVVSRLSLIHI